MSATAAPAPAAAAPSDIAINLFRESVAAGQEYFLVLLNGKLHWAKINMMFLDSFGQLVFDIDDQLVEVQLDDIVLSGKPGQYRTMIIKHPETHAVCFGRYVGHSGFFICKITGRRLPAFEFRIRGTNESVNIPVSAISPTFPTREETSEYDREFAKAAEAAEAERERTKAAEAASAAEAERARDEKAKAAKAAFFEGLKEQGMAFKSQPHLTKYPMFSDATLLVLFVICKMTKTMIGLRSYQFILCVVRLAILGDQSRFPHPSISEEDMKEFEDFKRNYNTDFVGRVMSSMTRRVQIKPKPSDSEKRMLTEQERRLIEYYCLLIGEELPTKEVVKDFLERDETFFKTLAMNISTTSESALTFPASYWLQSEYRIEVKALSFPMPTFTTGIVDVTTSPSSI